MSRDFDSPEYKTWRKRVFWRDNYTCQMPGCSRSRTPIEAHHIVRWVDAPKLRFVVSNGITLCKSCHDSILGCEDDYIDKLRGVLEGGNKTEYSAKAEKQVKIDWILEKYRNKS